MSEKIECPHCKTLNKVKREYCWVCGKSLKENNTKDEEKEEVTEVVEEIETTEPVVEDENVDTNDSIETEETTESDVDIDTTSNEEEIENKKENKVAVVVKIVSIMLTVCSIFAGLFSISSSLLKGITIIVAGIISSILIYALGEVVQLLEDIKNK